jgi:predicted nucleic acid-binding protein
MGPLDAIAGQSVYLDTNIFIYYLEDFPQFRTIPGELFRRLDAGEIRGVTSELALAEALVKPIRQKDAASRSIYEQMFASSRGLNVLPISREMLLAAAEIRATTSMKLPDAIHFATDQVASCAKYLTNDHLLTAQGSISILVLAELL